MALPGAPTNLLAAVVQLVLGLILAFAGYRIATSLAGLAGFLGGAALGFLLGTALGGPLVGLIAAIALGVVLAILASFALRVLAAVLAGGAAASVALAFGLATWMVVVLAIVVGLVGLLGHKLVLIVATAAIGASTAAAAGVYLAQRMGLDAGKEELTFLVAALTLAAIGIIVQARTSPD